ncbi:hypothetical protein VFPPC_15833 [Pochonia chlamydosporia 170]|uniref:Uncharacterized protein n=1 Tax=Pochonia chlamydosporia 170 TaxID=1380566 RepID=A0A179FTH7_METCM|nr:hypothetical protein VFPPC_15833 [Pochonia chlamydosporia 170]OAQ68510.1 hypothetical protein VFPPC_15833 [Pochonia chlamydosporia 170]
MTIGNATAVRRAGSKKFRLQGVRRKCSNVSERSRTSEDQASNIEHDDDDEEGKCQTQEAMQLLPCQINGMVLGGSESETLQYRTKVPEFEGLGREPEATAIGTGDDKHQTRLMCTD